MVTVDESRYDESPARRPQNILDVASLVCRSVAAQGIRRTEYTHVQQVRQTTCLQNRTGVQRSLRIRLTRWPKG